MYWYCAGKASLLAPVEASLLEANIGERTVGPLRYTSASAPLVLHLAQVGRTILDPLLKHLKIKVFPATAVHLDVEGQLRILNVRAEHGDCGGDSRTIVLRLDANLLPSILVFHSLVIGVA